MTRYFPDLSRLSGLQSNWQLAAMVFPPLLQGVMWSASISSSAKVFVQAGQTPFCLSKASRFMLSVKALIERARSLPLKM